MVSINVGPWAGLIISLLVALCLLVIAYSKKEPMPLVIGVAFMVANGFTLGSFLGAGEPISVMSGASLKVGHYYETLAIVPTIKKADKKEGLFVIKDGGSNKTLYIHIGQENLPPRFTVGENGDIIALPAPAPTASAPVVPK